MACILPEPFPSKRFASAPTGVGAKPRKPDGNMIDLGEVHNLVTDLFPLTNLPQPDKSGFTNAGFSSKENRPPCEITPTKSGKPLTVRRQLHF